MLLDLFISFWQNVPQTQNNTINRVVQASAALLWKRQFQKLACAVFQHRLQCRHTRSIVHLRAEEDTWGTTLPHSLNIRSESKKRATVFRGKEGKMKSSAALPLSHPIVPREEGKTIEKKEKKRERKKRSEKEEEARWKRTRRQTKTRHSHITKLTAVKKKGLKSAGWLQLVSWNLFWQSFLTVFWQQSFGQRFWQLFNCLAAWVWRNNQQQTQTHIHTKQYKTSKQNKISINKTNKTTSSCFGAWRIREI